MKNPLYIIIPLLFALFFYSSCETADTKEYIINQEICFTEITNLHPAIDSFYSQGVAVIDLNQDNYPEIYVTNSWRGNHNHFYQNENGIFIKDTLTIFANDKGLSNGCSFVDIDNDGLMDLCVANFNNELNRVYFGSENGIYQKVFIQPENKESWSYGVSFADVDNDGNLELYISNHHHQQNKFYQIKGHDFLEINSSIITSTYKSSFNAAWSDLNNDGLQDLIICNDSINELFQNLGDFKFKSVESKFTQKSKPTYGCSIADYNNDGLMDVLDLTGYIKILGILLLKK